MKKRVTAMLMALIFCFSSMELSAAEPTQAVSAETEVETETKTEEVIDTEKQETPEVPETETKQENSDTTEQTVKPVPGKRKLAPAIEPLAADNVAMIGETGYATIEDALAAASSGDTIVLNEDTASEKKVTIKKDKNIILDLNGKTLTTYVELYGSLTVTDTSADASGVITNNGFENNTIRVMANAEEDASAVLTVKGGTIRTEVAGTNAVNVQGVKNSNTVLGSVVLEDGCLESANAATGNASAALKAASGTTVSIKGGSVVNTTSGANGDKEYYFAAYFSDYVGKSITGGTFTGFVQMKNYADSSDVKGGTYTYWKKPSFTVAQGYLLLETISGTEWKVQEAGASLTVGDEVAYYENAALALKALGKKDTKVGTIQLFKADDSNLSVGADVDLTLDLNGNVLTTNIAVSGKLTITDSSDEESGMIVNSEAQDGHTVQVNGGGVLTLTNGTVKTVREEKGAVRLNGKETTGNAEFTMTGGSLESTVNGKYAAALYGNTYSVVDIQEGLLKNTADPEVDAEGKISNDSYAVYLSDGAESVTIGKNAEFAGYVRTRQPKQNEIVGGTYSYGKKPDLTAKDGFAVTVVTKDEVWTVQEAKATLTTAEEGIRYYENANAALGALGKNEEGTIQLLEDNEVSISIKDGKNVTLDLNGKILNGSVSLQEGTKLTVKDSSDGAGKITISKKDYAVNVSGEFVLESGIIENTYTKETAAVRVKDGGTAAIKGGYVNVTKGTTLTVDEATGGKILVSGGYFTDDALKAYLVKGKLALATEKEQDGITYTWTVKDEPKKPDESKPEKPSKPNKDKNSSSKPKSNASSSAAQTVTAAKTGDMANPMLWAVLMLAAVLVAGGAFAAEKRKKNLH